MHLAPSSRARHNNNSWETTCASVSRHAAANRRSGVTGHAPLGQSRCGSHSRTASHELSGSPRLARETVFLKWRRWGLAPSHRHQLERHGSVFEHDSSGVGSHWITEYIMLVHLHVFTCAIAQLSPSSSKNREKWHSENPYTETAVTSVGGGGYAMIVLNQMWPL